MSLALTIQLFGPDSPLHLPAYRFFIDPARFVLGLAGRRGAKTYTAAKKFIQRVWDDFARRKQLLYLPGAARRGTVLWWQRRARLHYWICADTYELLDEPKRYLLQFLPEELIDHVDNAKGRWWLKGDILIEFKTVRNPQKKVGSGLDGMWIEEAARVRADAWPLYLRPALADKQGWCIATTTPLGRDWTWEAFERPANDHVPGYSSHWWPTAANTRAPGLQAEVAHARATLAPEYFEREWEASRQAFIGQVYRGFARARVSVSKLPDGIQFQRILGGCDWGFSNPGALLVAGLTFGERPVLWFLDEVYSASLLVEDFWAPEAIKLQQKWRFNEWVADPAEPDNLVRFQRAGIRVSKHRNYGAGTFDEHARSVLSGIRTLSSLLHQDRIRILGPRCPNLTSEFENYVWQLTPAGLQLEQPAPHQKDHAVTVARYVASTVERGPLLRAIA